MEKEAPLLQEAQLLRKNPTAAATTKPGPPAALGLYLLPRAGEMGAAVGAAAAGWPRGEHVPGHSHLPALAWALRGAARQGARCPWGAVSHVPSCDSAGGAEAGTQSPTRGDLGLASSDSFAGREEQSRTGT